jgi:putative ABC transport system permease protein
MHGEVTVDAFLNDLRYAARGIRRNPGFSSAAILTLALGIAANNTVFTLVNAVFLRPMPFDHPDRLVEFGTVSYLDLQDMRLAVRTFEGIGAVRERTMSVADEGVAAQRYRGAYVSANGFGLIGRRPVLGRDFQPADERPGAAAVVILSETVWRQRYQRDPQIVGRTIRVNGVPSAVIGVMPEGFEFPQTSQLWQPVSLERAEILTDRRASALRIFGRLRDDVTIEQARADVAAADSHLARTYPDVNRLPNRPMGYYRSGIGTDIGLRMVFTFMMGAVAFVLLIACANVANLLLARSASRSSEIALRLSLGAGRWQIVRQLLVESALLAFLAGVVGLTLSLAGVRILWSAILATGDTPPYWLAPSLDVRVLAFFLVACLGTAIVSGIAPAWLTSQTRFASAGSGSGSLHTTNRHSRRWTGTFVIVQLALTLVLLSGAGVMMRSLLAQASTDAGVDTASLLALHIDLPPGRYATADQRTSMFQRIEDDFTAVPGVRLSYASAVPLGGAAERTLVTDRDVGRAEAERPIVGVVTIGANYFETLGTRPLRGRAFERRDIESGHVAIVNERLAAMQYPGEEPIGQRLRLFPGRARGGPSETESDWLTIVGIAPDMRQRSSEGGAFDPIVYAPISVTPMSGATLLARSSTNQNAAVTLIQEHMRSIDPDVPLFDIRTVDQQIAFNNWPQRIFGSVFAVFAAIALLLATVGLYAVTAYAASQRVKEIGIRAALGATQRQIRWTVTRTAAARLGIGLVIGTAGGVAVSRLLPSQLSGASGNDSMTLAVVAGVLVMSGLLACWIPARRAARLEPVIALRAD